MTFEYNNNFYDVLILKKNNKNTYVRVRDNKVYVTTNYFTSERKIKKLLEENRTAIGKMIDRSIERERKNELFLLFGKFYKIVYGDFDSKITVEEGLIEVIDQKTLITWLESFIHTTFYNHLKYWYDEFEEDIPNPGLKIRKMKSRWGVCNTEKKVVTLNFELFRYDIECLDYVIIHELSHFLEPNHSKNFWKIVERYCPDYKEIRKKLRNG